MTKRLKKIEPVQLAKMLAVIYGLGSLVFVPFFILFSVIAAIAPAMGPGSGPLPIMLGMGIGFMILAPLFYAFIGFITGLIGACLYNLVAGWIGGIEFEVE